MLIASLSTSEKPIVKYLPVDANFDEFSEHLRSGGQSDQSYGVSGVASW